MVNFWLLLADPHLIYRSCFQNPLTLLLGLVFGFVLLPGFRGKGIPVDGIAAEVGRVERLQGDIARAANTDGLERQRLPGHGFDPGFERLAHSDQHWDVRVANTGIGPLVPGGIGHWRTHSDLS